MAQAETPFMTFWRALIEECRSKGYPEPLFGVAHRTWTATIDQAKRDAFAFAMKQAALPEVAG